VRERQIDIFRQGWILKDRQIWINTGREVKADRRKDTQANKLINK
jgi:hypothetical protein